MTISERQEFCKEIFKDCLEILNKKGLAYSGEEKANSNFNNSAIDSDLTRYQIWQVFFNKHKDTIKVAIRTNPERPIDKTEGMRGRIIDAINYLAILGSMLEEDGLSTIPEPDTDK